MYQNEAMDIYRAGVEVPLVGGGPTERPRSHSNTTQRQGASSYWSVTEEQDFQRCLEYYGTDFQLISNHMGTKTHTMVSDAYVIAFLGWADHQQIKNHYQKFVNDGKHGDLIQRANEATLRRQRGEDMGPPPVPSQPVKRHGRYDTANVPMPRSLAPNSEVADSEQSPPANVAVPFGLSPQFGPHSNVPSAAPRTSAALPTSAPGSRPHNQPGPMLGYFKEDARQPQTVQNTIRPLIAPPEEPRLPRGPERIKTEFRPAEHEREMLARQERERERDEIIRRAAEIEARNAQIAARDQERAFHHSHRAHPSTSSLHGMSPTSEHVRQESRGPLSMFGVGIGGPAMHANRGVVDLTSAQAHPAPHPLDRRPQSPARHHMHPGYTHQGQSQPAAPSPPAAAAAKEAPKRSNLMSLLNSEPEQEAPKRREPEAAPAQTHQNRIATTVDTPPAMAPVRDAPMLDRPYSRTTFPGAAHSNSTMSTPTHESLPTGRESLPPMAHRDSWPGQRPQAVQATNSPHLHAQHQPPVQDRLQERVPFLARNDYRQTAFGALNGPTRANPSPPPGAGAYGHHSRTPSYSHSQHPTPPSSMPMTQTSQPPAHHGFFGQRETHAPGVSPHLGPQHQPPSSRPELGHVHPRLQERETALFDRFRERERDRERNEAFEFGAVRERVNEREREREQQLAREREYHQEQLIHQQRFGHHTPPVSQQRYAPPQAVPERNTATPLSHGGFPAQREMHNQQAYTQRQFEFEQEQQRRDFERERSRQSRIHEAAAAAEERQRQIQLEALRRGQQESLYRRPEERYQPGMPPR